MRALALALALVLVQYSEMRAARLAVVAVVEVAGEVAAEDRKSA